MDSSDDEQDVFSPTLRKTSNGSDQGPMSPSPAKGAGAQLTAMSPRGQPGSSLVRKDATSGKTIVEVTTYDKFDSNREYCGTVQKSAKYSGKWVDRFISLRDIDLSYSLADGQQPKDIIRLHKVTRGAEVGREALALVCEGVGNRDRKQQEFVFKTNTAEETELWYLRLCHCLAANNMMEMPGDHLPLTNPRTGLKFVRIPLQHLGVFAPLDRLVLHFFSPAVHKHQASAGVVNRMVESPAYVFVGDLCVYVCDPKADIKRCINVRAISGLLTVGGTSGDWLVGLQCVAPEFDLMFTMQHAAAEQFASVITTIYGHFGVSKKAKDAAPLKRQKLAQEKLLTPQLSLAASDSYELKIRLPMSKRYLLKMVADGVAGGQLVVKDVVRSLDTPAGPQSSDKSVASPLAPATAMSTSTPLQNVNAGAAPAGPVTSNPLNAAKAAPPPAPDSDSDDSVADFVKRKPAASGAPAPAPPRPTFDDSDSDDDNLPKASPLANAFGGTTRQRVEKGGAGPSPPVAGNGVHIAQGVDKMHRLLNTIGLPQYYAILTDRGVDWEIFSCMDTFDLKKFGVDSVDHQIRIENALNAPKLMEALKNDAGSAPAPPPPPPGAGKLPGPPPGPPPAPTASRAAVFIDDDDL
jgi:hypothetical protein